MVEFNSRAATQQRNAAIRQYLERRQLYPFQVATKPSDELGLLVVIPCFDEPDISRTLGSLARCEAPGCDVEILVVVNGPDAMAEKARANNSRALREVADWRSGVAGDLPDWLRLFALRSEQLPVDQAGVGLARKIGMDEAVGRIGQTHRAHGVIVSLDADCEVARNYLCEINKEFVAHPDSPGASIYYEHRLMNADSDALRAAIIDYELHLRCYVAGQRAARFPYAFHTVGSAMACRGSSYAEQGGMNRRQGGEDFYFIQKLVALGDYRALNSTTVYPAARLSNRVPFGTGSALQNSLDAGGALATFSPQIFRELEAFCTLVLFASPSHMLEKAEQLPVALKEFLRQQDFSDRLAEIQKNVAGPANFRKRVFRWFNAFRFLKFAQFASRKYHPKIPVGDAAIQIANFSGISDLPGSADNKTLLTVYRRLDRQF
ncbi:MAG: hypothetical protein OER85_00535 [Gammaproteobacteria bacterium]|nr:hypothetical protein [Gammaproteobacteria bacterium]